MFKSAVLEDRTRITVGTSPHLGCDFKLRADEQCGRPATFIVRAKLLEPLQLGWIGVDLSIGRVALCDDHKYLADG
jgi:hypothetical protein